MEFNKLGVVESAGLRDLPHVAKEVIALTANTKVILFQGNLGAGKTTLVKEVCRALNCTDEFSSPTYSIVNEYKTSDGNPVYHIDLYRLKTQAEAADAGVEEYLFSGHYCLVEWFENAKGLLPEKYILVRLEGEGNTRKISIFGFS